jgi:hypothetical protein
MTNVHFHYSNGSDLTEGPDCGDRKEFSALWMNLRLLALTIARRPLLRDPPQPFEVARPGLREHIWPSRKISNPAAQWSPPPDLQSCMTIRIDTFRSDRSTGH